MIMAQNWVRRPDDGSSHLARSIVLKLLQCLGLKMSFLRGAGGAPSDECKTFGFGTGEGVRTYHGYYWQRSLVIYV